MSRVDNQTRDLAAVAMPRRQRSAQSIEAATAYLFVTPATLLLFLLLLGPAASVVVLSFTDWQFGSKTFEFIGFTNYAEMFQDDVFWTSITNTLIYVSVVVVGSVSLGLMIAMLIESRPSFRRVWRTIYFLPVTATLVAMALVFEYILHPAFGPLNEFLGLFGVEGTNWLQNRSTALLTLCGIGIWQAVGFNMVLFLAGLTAIPTDLYDAVAIDGSDSTWDRFCVVVWPLLGPTTMFVVIISCIRSFQVFDTVKVLTDGGPNRATEVLLFTMFSEGFTYFRSGYAAALTTIFLIFVLILTLVQRISIEKRIHYG
jgi:multiple sugar transport system permease protein